MTMSKNDDLVRRLREYAEGSYQYPAYRGRPPAGTPQLKADILGALGLADAIERGAAQGRWVKQLDWVKHPNARMWRAETMLGIYEVADIVSTVWQFKGYRDIDDAKRASSEAEAKAAAQADYEQRILSALDLSTPPAPAPDAGEPTHRHKKRGSEYVLLGIGKMQSSYWHDFLHGLPEHAELVDMREVAIYRSVYDGSLWVRPREEFEDGRFEALPTPQPPAVEAEGEGDA